MRTAALLLSFAATFPVLSFGATTAEIELLVTPAVPDTPPTPITDLTAQTNPSAEGQVLLSWTAPDANTPPVELTVSSYTVKMATFSVDSLLGDTTAWWNLASAAPASVPIPQSPGTSQSLTMVLLEPGTTLYFAIRSLDASGNLSPIDSKAAASGQQASAVIPNLPPPAPSSLAASFGDKEVFLAWSTVTAYDLDFYRVFQGSVSNSGPFLAVTTTTLVNYTAQDLTNNVTYYFFVRSQDRAGAESSNSTIVSTVPVRLVPPVVSNLDADPDPEARAIRVTWTNPTGSSLFAGTLLLRSTAAADTLPSDFASYSVGDVLGNASVVFKGTGNSLLDTAGLSLGNTYYYTAHTFTSAPRYDEGVSTAALLHLAPSAPTGIQGQDSGTQTLAVRQAAGGFFLISWSTVTAFSDGTAFVNPSAPDPKELSGYELYRATGPTGPWGLRASLGLETSYLDNPGSVNYHYKVNAINSLGRRSKDSLVINTAKNVIAIAPDSMSMLTISADNSNTLVAAGNSLGVDLVVEPVAHPEEESGSVINSLEFRISRADDGQTLSGFAFPEGNNLLSLNSAGGSSSGAGVQVSARNRPAAAGDIDIFWFNGVKWVQQFATVNEVNNLLSMNTGLTGQFQVRSVLRSNQFTFSGSDISPRIITPNSDGKNDVMIFRFNNPGNASVEIKLFDIRGAFVTDVTAPGPTPGSTLQWDGKSGGKVVHSGIYMYQLKAESRTFTGTVVVAR